jgi:hypothetical protein
VLSGFGVAVPAVYRLVAARLKRHFGLFATLSAGDRIHLTGAPIAKAATTSTETLGFSGRTTRRTTFGLIGEAFGGEEFLFFSRKGESFSAVGTLQGFFRKSHWMTSYFLLGSIWVIQRFCSQNHLRSV